MEDNKIQDDWEEVSLDSADDWEEVELEETSSSNDIATPNVGAIEASLLAEGAKDVTSSKPVQTLKKNIKAAGASTLGKLGPLDTEDVKTLYQNADRYKELKKTPGQLGDKFAKFAKEVEDVGYTATKKVGDVLEAQGKELKTADLMDQIEQKAGGALYEPDEARLAEAKGGQEGLKSAERKRIKAQQELEKQSVVKNKTDDFFEKRTRELDATTTELEDRLREYEANKGKKLDLSAEKNRKLVELNDKLSELRDEKLEYRRAGGSKDAIFDIIEEENKLKDAKRRLSEALQEDYELIRKDQEVVDELKKQKLELTKNRKELSYNKKDQLKDINRKKAKISKKLDKLNEEFKSAKETAKATSIKTKSLSPEVDAFMKTLKDRVSNKKVLKGSDLASLQKYLNKQYGKTGSDEVRRAMREIMQGMSDYVGESGAKAARAITDYENLLKDLPLESRDAIGELGKGKNIRQGSAFNRGLGGLMRVEEGAELTAKNDLIKLLKSYGREDLVTDAELNKILQSTKEGQASALDALAAAKTGGLAVAPTTRTVSTIGAKLQELGTRGAKALSKIGGNPIVKGLGKATLGALPLATFASDYQQAEEIGLEGPLQQGAYALAEQLNPSPISIADMVKQAPARAAAARDAGKANYGGYEAGKPLKQKPDRQVVAKLESLKSDENINYVAGKMTEMDSTAAKDYARVLNQLEGADQGKKNTTLMGLLQQPAFRELLRRAEKDDEDGSEN